MRQHSNVLKCRGTSANEYVQAEENSNVKRRIVEQEQKRVEQVECSSNKTKDVKVTLIFPTASDSKAETEFISRLKEIYLKKIEAKAMQEETQALYYNPISKGEQLKHSVQKVSLH